MNTKGRFGQYGGQYVPEIVMPALNELEAAYLRYKRIRTSKISSAPC